MKANPNAIPGHSNGIPKAARPKFVSMANLPLLTFAVAICAVQPTAAQHTVRVGGQSPTPGVTINLNAIYGGTGSNAVAPLPSQQRHLAPAYGGRQLLIPNLRMPSTQTQFALRPPGQTPAARTPAAMPELKRAPMTTARPAVKAAPAQPRVAARRPAAPPAPPKPAATPSMKDAAPAKPAMKEAIAETPAVNKPAPAKVARLAPPPPPPSVTRQETPPKAQPAPPPKAAAPKVEAPKAEAPASPASKTLAPPPPPPPPSIVRETPKAEATKAGSSAPKAAAKPRQVAALPPSSEGKLQIRFRNGSSVLSRDDEAALKSLVKEMAPSEARLQLKAYAAATGNDNSKARRLSLSRALAVRSFLIENGLRSTRIDVRALGIARDGGVPDRVDVVVLSR